jgi:hypothetical protein
MGLLGRAQQWDERLEATKAAWVAKGPAAATKPARTARRLSASSVVLVLAIEVVAEILQPGTWWANDALWFVPFLLMPVAYFGLLGYFAYFVIRTAVDHGVRRALRHQASLRTGEPLDR